jgi:hypothetical protein
MDDGKSLSGLLLIAAQPRAPNAHDRASERKNIPAAQI